MTLNEIIEFLKNYKGGTFLNIYYKSSKKLPKKYGEPLIEKYSSGVYRLGVKFSNLKENKNRIVNERPWGVNVAYLENYLVEHNGKYYLKIYTTKHKTKTKYFINGNETTKTELEANFGYKTSPKSAVFTIAIENILQLGKA